MEFKILDYSKALWVLAVADQNGVRHEASVDTVDRDLQPLINRKTCSYHYHDVIPKGNFCEFSIENSSVVDVHG